MTKPLGYYLSSLDIPADCDPHDFEAELEERLEGLTRDGLLAVAAYALDKTIFSQPQTESQKTE